MSSEVEICNLALANIGDSATVASLYPPEGSAQAEHCARFYPIARDSLLEMHPWGFATKRIQLPLLTSNWSEWDYCYALPNDTLNLLAVLPPDATDDYSATTVDPDIAGLPYFAPVTVTTAYTPQPYTAESLDDGTQVIYTDQVGAVLRYTLRVTDSTKFSPLFVTTLGWHLASMLAGPILKGDAGAAESKRCAAMAQAFLARATESDANQRRTQIRTITPWISGR